MTSKKLFFYVINFTAALLLNIGLIVLTTKNNIFEQAKLSHVTQENNKKKLSVIEITSAQKTINPVSIAALAQPETNTLHARLSLEAELFYERSQQLLSGFNKETISNRSSSNNKYNKTRGISPLHCYTKKTLDQIESFKKDLRRKYFPMIAKGPSVEKNPLLEVTINKNGSIASIFVTQSSGNKYLDKFWIQLFKKAAPFPTIPSYLHLNQLTICT